VNWPNDADGDVLRRLKENGFEFDNEVEIDFNIDFNHWPLTDEEVEKMQSLYSQASFYDPDEEGIENGNLYGYVQFQVVAKLTYDLVINTQERVTEQMKQYGGWCESWGLTQE